MGKNKKEEEILTQTVDKYGEVALHQREGGKKVKRVQVLLIQLYNSRITFYVFLIHLVTFIIIFYHTDN